MRSHLPDFSVLAPRDLSSATTALAELASSGNPPVILAGGTDLMVALAAGILSPGIVMSLGRIPELAPRIEAGDEGLRLSALTTYTDARWREEIRKTWPLLARAAKDVGVIAIQNMGTWAGNIMNASPAADGVPALLAYDASVELISSSGKRVVPLADFFLGYKKTARRPDEILSAILMPRPPKVRREYFRKVGARQAQAVAKVVMAGWLAMDADGAVAEARLALGSVAPVSMRARRVEDFLRRRALDAETLREAERLLQEEITPIDDIRSTARYRRQVAGGLLREFLSRRD